MYICARCLGLYGGILGWGLLLIYFNSTIPWIQSLAPLLILGICNVLTLPLVMDWWLQCKAIRHSSNWSWLFTGLLTSLSGIIMLVSIQAYWVTFPTGALWYLIVNRKGRKWKQYRSIKWGCLYCRKEVPSAKPIWDSTEENARS